MPFLYILFAFSSILDKANRYFLPCPFKYLTGYDCPGCGFQRSFVALLKGDLQGSLHLYPATIPILITVAVSLSANFWYPAKSKLLLKTLFLITASIMLISYGFKVFVPHTHIDGL